MARYTPAYSSFVSRLDEVEILRRFAAQKERKDAVRLRHEINALCRGAIVLLSGHLEAYVKDLGEITLDSFFSKSVPRGAIAPQFYYHISKDIIEKVKDTADPTKIADQIFSFLQSDYLFWERTGSFSQPVPVDRFNKGFSNPTFPKIRAYFNRFGYAAYKHDLARSLRANYQVTVNMVDHLVDTRNKIAHGDQTVTKTPRDVQEMVAIIKLYCLKTDALFAAWCKANHCSIR